MERLRNAHPLQIDGSHPVAQVLASGVPLVIHDMTDPVAVRQTAQSDEHQRFMQDGRLSLCRGLPNGGARAHARDDLLLACGKQRSLSARPAGGA